MGNPKPKSKSKMAFFKNIGQNVARVKQVVAVKIGTNEATVDPQFNQLEIEFKEIYSKMKRLGKEVQNYQTAIKELGQAQNGIAQMILDQYDQSDQMNQAAIQLKEITTKEIEGNRQRLEQYYTENFHQPLSHYLLQYKLVDERIAERNTRLIDKDRYNEDYKTLASKNESDPTRLQIAKEKSEYKSRSYQDLNDELLRDIPKLLQDRARFFDALFANLVQGQFQYLAETARALGLLDDAFNNVNRLAVRSWPFVITDTARSHHSGGAALPPSGPPQSQQPTQSVRPQQPQQPAPQQVPQQFQQQQQQFQPPQQFQPTPAPSAVPRARALFPFQGQDHTELTFQPGEIITVYRQAGDWWEGELNGRRGLFPAAYVQLA